MRADWQDVYRQFSELPYRHVFGPCSIPNDFEVHFIPPDVDVAIAYLRDDWRFKEGVFHLLHDDIGGDRVDFRSHTGELGWGSMQISISQETGRGMADVDARGFYTDVWGQIGHAGEVIAGWWRKVNPWG